MSATVIQQRTANPTTITRRLYQIGSLTFIAIGLFHTLVHFQDLSGGDLERRFDQVDPVMLGDDAVRSWDLFQGVSLLMGFFAIAIGAINLGALTGRATAPPVVGMVTIAALLAVIVVGFAYLGLLQTVGGAIGIGLFLPTALGVGRAAESQ